MTQLIGRPDIPANTPLKATVTYTSAYQRGDALGLGTMTYQWDWTDSRWELTDGTISSLIAARFGQTDPVPPLLRILFRVGTGDGTVGRPIEVPAAETAAGVLDVTKPLTTAPYIRGQELTFQLARLDALVSQGNTNQARADTDHTRATQDHQQVTENLAAIAQVQADWTGAQQTIEQLATSTATYTYAGGTGPLGDPAYGAYGYAGMIGSPTDLAKIDVLLRGQSQDNPATTARVMLRDGGPDGAILVDRTYPVTVPYATPFRQQFALPRPIAGTRALWLDLRLDGPADMYMTTGTAPDTDPWPRVATTPGTAPTEIGHGLPKFRMYVEYYTATYAVEPAPAFVQAVLEAQAGAVPPYGTEYPGAFYSLVGRTARLYPDVLHDLAPPREQWSLDVFCPQFGAFDGYAWSGTPDTSDVGLGDMLLVVWHGADRVSMVDVPHRIVAATAGGGVTRKLLIAGDSHVRRGHLQVGLKAVLNATSGYAAQFLGTQFCEADNTIRNEGYPGQTLSWLDHGPGSPFNQGGSFNVQGYLNYSSQTLGPGDWLIIHTGSNEVAGAATAAEVLAQAQANIEIINRVRTQCAGLGVRLGITTTLPFLHAPHTRHYEVARSLYMRTILPALLGREGEGLYVLPVAQAVDPAADLVGDVVHPTPTGYHHEAEALAAALKYVG